MVARLLPEASLKHAEKYPRVGVQILDGNQNFVLSQVRAGIPEFGVSLHLGDDEDLIFEPFLNDRYAPAVHRDDPFADARSIPPGDLKHTKLIIGGRDSGNRLRLEMLLGQESVRLRWFCDVEHISRVTALVEPVSDDIDALYSKLAKRIIPLIQAHT